MADERARGATTRDEPDPPIPRAESDRPVQGDKSKEPTSAATPKRDLPPRTGDMDQPGMDPEEEH